MDISVSIAVVAMLVCALLLARLIDAREPRAIRVQTVLYWLSAMAVGGFGFGWTVAHVALAWLVSCGVLLLLMTTVALLRKQSPVEQHHNHGPS